MRKDDYTRRGFEGESLAGPTPTPVLLWRSHANPWFGRSLTPFNCTLNYSKEDHITFDEDEDLVIGRARFDTHAGELFQTYAWAPY